MDRMCFLSTARRTPCWTWLLLLLPFVLMVSVSSQHQLDQPALNVAAMPVDLDFGDIEVDLQRGIIHLPEIAVNEYVLGFPLALTLANMVCSIQDYGDFELDHTDYGDFLHATFRLKGLALSCGLDFDSSWFFFSGQGRATMWSANNQIQNHMMLQQSEEEQTWQFSIESCDPSFNVISLEFQHSNDNNNLAFFVLSALEPILKETMEMAMETASCQIGQAVEGTVEDILFNVTHIFEPFQTRPNVSNLQGINFTSPVINYSQPKSLMAKLLSSGMQTVGKLLENHSNNTTEGMQGGSIFSQITSAFLDADPHDGSISLPFLQDLSLLDTSLLSQLPLLDLNASSEIVELVEQLLGVTDIKINEVAIYGLENFPTIGNLKMDQQTLRVTNLALPSLSIAVQGHVQFGDDGNHTGNETDGALQSSDTIPFDLWIGLSDLNASASVLLALDESILNQLRIGNLLSFQDILCHSLLAVHHFGVTELTLGEFVSIGLNLSAPGIHRLNETTGIQPLLLTILNSGILEFGWALYEDVFIEALPEMIRQTLPSVYGAFARAFTSPSNCANNAKVPSNNLLLDFRDLFLSSLEAKGYGGSGEEPYGSFISQAKKFMDETLLAPIINTSTASGLLLNINDKVLGPLTEQLTGVTGSLALTNGSWVQMQQGLNMRVTIGVEVSDVRIDNLDTLIFPTTVMEPQMGYASALYNRINLGLPVSPLRLHTIFSFDVIVNNETRIHNKLQLQAETDSIALVATPIIKLLEESFLNFPVGDIFDIQCWLAALAPMKLGRDGNRMHGAEASFSLSELDLVVGDAFRFQVDCVECSGPTTERIVAVVNSFDNYESTDSNSFFASPNELIKTMSSLFFDGGPSTLQAQVDRMLMDAPKHCRHHPDFDPNASPGLRNISVDISSLKSTKDESISFLVAVVTVASLAILGAIGIWFLFYFGVSLRYHQWLRRLPLAHVEVLSNQARQEKARKTRINNLCGSMFGSRDIGLFVRMTVPTLLLASAGLFLVGILSEALVVRVDIQVGGRGVFATELPFTVASVASDAWKIGGKGLALFVIAGSGLWPQIKQFGTIALWFLPTSILPVDARGWALRCFDFLGKWTMASVFLFSISIAVFRFEITSPQKLLSEELYMVDILLVPSWGLYATSIAQVLALITSHICIRYHYTIVSCAECEEANIGSCSEGIEQDMPQNMKSEPMLKEDERSILDRNSFSDIAPQPTIIEPSKSRDAMEISIPVEEATEDVQALEVATLSSSCSELQTHTLAYTMYSREASRSTQVASIFINLTIFPIGGIISLLVVGGCIFPSFARDVRGLLGLVLNTGASSEEIGGSTQAFSVLTTVQRFLDHGSLLLDSNVGHFVGHLWLASLLLSSVCLVPILQSQVLLIQWFCPTSQRWRDRLQASIQIMQSFQSMEVFLLSAVMFALQLGGMTKTIVPTACQPLENMTSSLASYGILDENDTQCFGYDGSVRFASLLLLFAVILLYLLTFVVSLMVSYTKDDKASARAGAALGITKDGSNTATSEDLNSSSGLWFLEKIYTFPLLFHIFDWILSQQRNDRNKEEDSQIHETDDSSEEARPPSAASF